MATHSRQHALTQARLLFNQQGAVPGGLVAEPILRSWRRCADLGFDMRGVRRAELMTQGELREAQQRNEALRRLSEPAMSLLRRQAGGNGGLVILSDAQGLVLDSDGDTGFAQRASRVALMPGAPWDEAAAGTNAIGTALVEGRPIAVHGAEHYFEPNRILTCAAVPITDSEGRTLGVLDLSSPARDLRPDVLELVRAAVDLSEHRLFEQAYEQHAVLRLHVDHAGLGAPGEGLLAFQGDLLIGANRRALQALGLAPTALGVYRYGDVFDGDMERGPDAAGRVQARSGAVYHARLRWPRSRAPQAPARPALPPATGARPATPNFDAATLGALARAVHLSDAGVSILLQGETGVGKEVFARELHARGKRASGPFVAVNCAALPESLIESELFGYEEGAFTGARRQGSKGLLRQAHGGVLFLDEIGDMPLVLQSRLLRVLQTREVSPLGAARPVSVDFALVCATHRPLAHEGPDAPVRPDLYFRIAEYTVTLEPLRARADRLELLRGLWAAQGAGPVLPADIEAILAAYAWPGNYRQLVAVLRTLHVLAGPAGMVDMDMLPADIRSASAVPQSVGDADPANLQAMTDAAIRDALAAHGGNVSRAARALGVHRSTLYRRLPRPA
ncbi:Acetoin catabolism regulatory protein [Achromobacter insolitus]|uniref:sigma-54-dependent Fis family transcriptional regulator n=1 Tax=Achromobacter insolitus TaxID=217204 RepID=UPI000972B45E|nr:sigma-54-dependent Fis family transcriptional regulator [Achromobacter insolitus]APX78189.1 sigma-54-dependent Fis family transcriptional regulator [Achromobacter insolitus]OWT62666.1 sigma-54-dependent Fis family transcriptional regulator [Achromobacter insolitus]CAB3658221.1 Acetoin catabolism regulatory protein [Achromobacter insolitus]VEG65792.1 Acetoin catabolism regulatory protein [Achromobacter insolitus]